MRERHIEEMKACLLEGKVEFDSLREGLRDLGFLRERDLIFKVWTMDYKRGKVEGN